MAPCRRQEIWSHDQQHKWCTIEFSREEQSGVRGASEKYRGSHLTSVCLGNLNIKRELVVFFQLLFFVASIDKEGIGFYLTLNS